jgi:predicted extracellular nuclease
MKRIFTFLTAIALGSVSFGQVFQSDLSSWAAGDPTDWMGTKTTIASSNVVEQTIGVSFGTSSASLINDTGTHKRFTTQAVNVIAGETYEIKMWVTASMGDLRTNYYDLTNAAYGTYNPYMDLATLSGGNQVMVSQTVTMPAGCSSAEFILSLRNTDPSTSGAPFFIGIILDSVSITTTTPPVITYSPIYDIQYTTDATGDSPLKDSIRQTSGIVTGVFQIGSNAGRYFIQDGPGAWNGIYVYDNANTVALGDSVVVTGTVQEYNSLTELGYVSSVTVVSSGNAMPAPVDVTGATYSDEMYEGVLVRVVDVENTVANDQYGVWILNDGSDILIDDDCMPAQYTSTVGNHYSVIGVRHLSFGENKIYPRDEATDITITGYASLKENMSNVSIYPNPATSNVTVKGVNGQVEIYSISGAKVYSNVINGTLLINVEDLTNGVYFIKVTENNAISSYKLIVE